MTENEAKWEYYRAIGLIERIKTEETHERYIDRHKAFDLAIQALKEIQQYRAIGTVEELKTMKENGAFTADELVQLVCMQMYLKDYKAIGTIDEFKALKEKIVAKKATYDNDDEIYICPNCGKSVGEHQNYCWNCGQAFET